jgi:segregation and condensation protein A
MAHTVVMGQYEGPLGTLLNLIERNQVSVSKVSVGQITSQYLEKVRSLQTVSVEELSEFLQLGARLVYIKSLALLPQSSVDEQNLELAQLTAELAEYRRYQAAAKLLARRLDMQTWPHAAAASLTVAELPFPNLSLEQLAQAFTKVMKLSLAAPPVHVIKPHLSLETAMTRLRTKLKTGFDLSEIIVACRDRMEVIVHFLAVLELVRSGAARVIQAGQLEPIRVEAAHD